MKKRDAFLLYIGMVIIGIGLIYAFTRPYWLFWLSSDEANIGNAINGITAPFIALFGAILVYISFKEQVKANNNLTKQNTFNMTLNLINELKHDIQSAYTENQSKSVARYITAIEKRTKIVSSTARRFNYILKTFNHIIERVKNVDLEEEDKDALKLNLINIYDTYLDKHCDRLTSPNLPSITSDFKKITIESGQQLKKNISVLKK